MHDTTNETRSSANGINEEIAANASESSIFQRIRVENATNEQLNWLVALCEKRNPSVARYPHNSGVFHEDHGSGPPITNYAEDHGATFKIMEREHIHFRHINRVGDPLHNMWLAQYDSMGNTQDTVRWREASTKNYAIEMGYSKDHSMIRAGLKCFITKRLAVCVSVPKHE